MILVYYFVKTTVFSRFLVTCAIHFLSPVTKRCPNESLALLVKRMCRICKCSEEKNHRGHLCKFSQLNSEIPINDILIKRRYYIIISLEDYKQQQQLKLTAGITRRKIITSKYSPFTLLQIKG